MSRRLFSRPDVKTFNGFGPEFLVPALALFGAGLGANDARQPKWPKK